MNKLGFSSSQASFTRRKRGLEIGIFHIVLEQTTYHPKPTRTYIDSQCNIEVTVYSPGYALGVKIENNF